MVFSFVATWTLCMRLEWFNGEIYSLFQFEPASKNTKKRKMEEKMDSINVTGKWRRRKDSDL
jgi:hypothetical protein